MKKVSGKYAGIAGALALFIALMSWNSSSAAAPSFYFIDGDEATGINYDTTKNAATPKSISFDGDLYVIWTESIGSTSQVRVKKQDGGSWVTADNDTPLNKDATKDTKNPDIYIYSNELYAAWEELGTGGYWQLRVAKFSGTSWSLIDGNGTSGLNASSTNGRAPKLIAYNNGLYVIYDQTGGNGINQMKVLKYDGSSSWSAADGGSSLNYSSTLAAQGADAVVFDGKLIVTWQENNSSSIGQARVKAFNGSSWSFIDGNQTNGLNYDTDERVTRPYLAVYEEELYVAWMEANKLRVKKYDGSGWSSADGGNNLNYKTAQNGYIVRLLVFDGDLYAIWHEGSSTYSIRVKKYDGTTWTEMDGGANIGLNKVATNTANYAFLTVHDSELQAVFAESASSVTQIRVKRFGMPNEAPTATGVGFTGTLMAGYSLTGSYTYGDAESNPQGTSTFKWYTATDAAGTGKTAISGATASTFTLTSAEVGKYILFEVTPVAAAGTLNGAPASFTGTSAVLANEAPTATAVGFTGTLKSGNLLTGSYTYGDTESDPQGATTFQWYTATDAAGTGKTAISGATASTFTLTTAEVGKYILFEVTPVATSGTLTGTPASYTGASAVLANAAPTATDVSMSGTRMVGYTLTGAYTYGDTESDPQGTTTFKWYTATDDAGAGKTEISGATANTLVLTAAEVGKYILFEVTPVATVGTLAGAPASISSGVAVLANEAPTATAVSFTGTMKSGNLLTGAYTYGDTESDPQGSTTFQWYTATDAAGTGKTAISGATANTFTLTSAEVGKYILFEVTPVATSGTLTGTSATYTGTSAVLANAAPTATNVGFTGTLKEGNTLTGAYTYGDTESDPQGTTTFQWYTAIDAAGAGKTAISGATASTFTLTDAEVGKHILFEVTPVAASGTLTGTPATYTGTSAVLANAAPFASSVSVSGVFLLNKTLTGSYAYSDTEGDLESLSQYKWYVADDALGTNKTEITGANAKTLTLKAAQYGKYVIFEVTPAAGSGTSTGTAVASDAVGTIEVLKGDANGDGVITPADALLATKHAQGKITLTAEQLIALDMDGDLDVDADDAQLILNVYLGKAVK